MRQRGPVSLRLRINGLDYDVLASTEHSLLTVLRDGLGLHGTKENCLKGECGVCTVLLDGQPVYSCLVLAVMAQGQEITTVEGLADRHTGQLGELQEAFLRHGALQCGYCTPGMLISAQALLSGSNSLSEAGVREGLAGNLCRCTGYAPIVDAVLDVAQITHRRATTNVSGTEA
jgi:carbon-monoxide dehydrogenase small subunit